MRIVFFGTPATAVPCLAALLAGGHEVPLVVTQPDRPVGRSRKPQPPEVKVAAIEAGIEVLQPDRVRSRGFRSTIEAAGPELLAVVAFGRILGPRLLATPPLGPVNVHFSLLPRYRGAAPVQWAIARGESVTGVTTMRMNERMDEGDILLQRQVEIGPGEHAPELQARLATLGAELLLETVAGLPRGEITARPQDHDEATHAPILSKRDGWVDGSMTAAEIDGRVRGFDPWPGVWFAVGGQRIRLLEAQVASAPASPGADTPGTLLATGDGLELLCAGGSRLSLLRVQREGRRPQSIAEAIRGRQLAAGDRIARPDTLG